MPTNVWSIGYWQSRFGERWGRHWLDVVRFGEHGELTVNDDKPRSNAWRFRDAVIRALNEDVPFDRLSVFILCRTKKIRSWGNSHLGTRYGIMRIRTTNSFIGWTIWWRRRVAFLGISFGARGAMIIR